MYPKKSLYTLALALGAVCAAPYAVAGKVITTAPLWADSPSYHACNVANVSTTDLKSVTVDLINSGGTVLATQTLEPLAAGQSNELNPGGYSGFARCRFTVVGSTSKIRANITVFRNTSDGNGNYYDVLGIESAR